MAAKDQPISGSMRDIVDIDRVIHEPARLVICAVLYAVKVADFIYLLKETGLTKGNLSSHLSKLEDAGYIVVDKTFEGKTPRTTCSMTDAGKVAFETYRTSITKAMDSTS